MTNTVRVTMFFVTLVLIYNFCDILSEPLALVLSAATLGGCFWLLKKYPVIITPSGGITMNALQLKYHNNNLNIEKRRKIVQVFVTCALALYWMRFVIGRFWFFFFSYTENTFKISDEMSPLLSWLIFGVLSGGAAGAMIYARKYRLPKQFAWIPLIFSLLVTIIMANVNKPMAAMPVVVAPAADTAVKHDTVVRAPKKKVKRRHKIKPKAQPAGFSDSVGPVIDQEAAPVPDSLIAN